MSKTNTGYYNTGDCNTGNYNTGDCNTGNYNTGDRNTGNCNTGNYNTGDRNTGNCNTGNCNTGNCNTGNCNTGSCNTGNCNTGYCNTVTPEDCLIFNKPAKRQDWLDADKPNWIYCGLTQWICESDMSDKEKDAYPSYVTTGGYLKAYATLQDAWKAEWDKASKKDKELTLKLPNYDREVFIEIFGFDPEEGAQSCAGKVVEIDGKKYELKELPL